MEGYPEEETLDARMANLTIDESRAMCHSGSSMFCPPTEVNTGFLEPPNVDSESSSSSSLPLNEISPSPAEEVIKEIKVFFKKGSEGLFQRYFKWTSKDYQRFG